MKKTVKIVSVLMVLALMTALLAACSKPEEPTKTLAEILATNEEAAASVQKLGEDDDMNVEVVENTINYSQKLDTKMNDWKRKQYQKSFKNAFEAYTEKYVDQIKTIEDATKISGVKIHVTITDAEDNILLDQEYDKNGLIEE